MKWLPALLAAVSSFAALAAEDQSKTTLKPLAATPKPGIVIINGKKFFPLQNARRFTASGPSAEMVMHHPRERGVIVTRGTRSSPVAAADSAASAAKAEPGDVLSVFAPEDKTVSPAAPLNAPMKP